LIGHVVFLLQMLWPQTQIN